MINHTNFIGPLETDVLEQVIMVDAANQYPLLAMVLGSNHKRVTDSERFEWYSSQAAARRTQINNGGLAYDAATTVLVVDNAAIFLPGDTALCEATGETFYVVASNQSTTITVSRSIGTVAAAVLSVADGAYLVNIGSAHGEGSGSPVDSAESKIQSHNYVQTVRKAVMMSGRMGRVKTKIEVERGFQRKKKFEELNHDLERMFFFGARNSALVDAQGNRVTTSGGLKESVTTHVNNIAGSMNQALFDQFTEQAFATGSSVKTLFAGSVLITALHNMHRGNVRVTQPLANVGLRISTITTAHGDLNLVPHRMFTGGLAGDGISVDTDEIWMRPTNGGDIQLKEDTQDKGVDGNRDEFFSEAGLEYGDESTHAQIQGVTGYAA